MDDADAGASRKPPGGAGGAERVLLGAQVPDDQDFEGAPRDRPAPSPPAGRIGTPRRAFRDGAPGARRGPDRAGRSGGPRGRASAASARGPQRDSGRCPCRSGRRRAAAPGGAPEPRDRRGAPPGVQGEHQVGIRIVLIRRRHLDLVAEIAEDARPAQRRRPIAGAGCLRRRRDEADLHGFDRLPGRLMSAQVSATDLVAMLQDARARTLELVAGLDRDRLMGPQLDIVNPASVGNRASRLVSRAFHPARARRAAAPDGGGRRGSTIPRGCPMGRAGRSRCRRCSTPSATWRASTTRWSAASTSRADAAGGRPLPARHLPRGHARRGLHLHAPDPRLSGAVLRRLGHLGPVPTGPGPWPGDVPVAEASGGSAPSRRRTSSSTTRNGRIRYRSRRSASRARR